MLHFEVFICKRTSVDAADTRPISLKTNKKELSGKNKQVPQFFLKPQEGDKQQFPPTDFKAKFFFFLSRQNIFNLQKKKKIV